MSKNLLTKEVLDKIKAADKYVKGVYEYDTECWNCGSRNLTEPCEYIYCDLSIWWYDCLDCDCEMDKESRLPPQLRFTSEILEEYEQTNGQPYQQ